MQGVDARYRFQRLVLYPHFAKVIALTIKEHMFSQYEWIVNKLHYHNLTTYW